MRTIRNTPQNPFNNSLELLTEYEKLLIDIKGAKNPNIKNISKAVEEALDDVEEFHKKKRD